MTHARRLSAQERRKAIVQAVKKVFAAKGFDGATTRELAEAAGVSEALLYKHFPSKVSLYKAMRDDCVLDPALDRFWRVMELEPSTSTLILLVHALAQKMIVDFGRGRSPDQLIPVLALRSLLDDGAFVRIMTEHFAAQWLPKFKACVKAARAAGDVEEGGIRPDLAGLFLQNLTGMMMFQSVPMKPVIDYGTTPNELVSQVVVFALRGAGLKQKAIKSHYNPRALALLTG
jgi:AcrR family transcriptional regulator